MIKLFIVGFPRNTEEIKLVELFSVYGTVESVTIITDQQTGISKGFGFITMTDQAGAERAIAAIDGMTMEGRQISVRYAEDKKQVPVAKPLLTTNRTDNSNSKENDAAKPTRKKRPRRQT